MPHDRVTTPVLFELIPSVGRFAEQFRVDDLHAMTGAGQWAIGLAMKFLADCGLVRKLSGRGIYESTRTAQEITLAWDKDPEDGMRALRNAWDRLWFVGASRKRTLEASAPRTALRLRFVQMVKTPGYEKNIDRLLDLMIAVGFLVAEDDGFLRWYENSPDTPTADQEQPAAASSESSSAEQPGGEAPDEPQDPPSPELDSQSETAAGLDDGEVTVPGPRSGNKQETRPRFGAEADKLLTHRLGVGEAWHLTPGEAAALHDHVTGLLTVLSGLEARMETDGTPLNPELLGPMWSLARIADMDQGEWLTTHQMIRQFGSLESFRKEHMNS
ncbi:hypothetical protein [Streptomyces sp. NPDC048638]|uniref:hypothetical protein n=1 Tax=Streptomyces sp. NPDC048638 TaxID=3365580 RepID=UPI0037238930